MSSPVGTAENAPGCILGSLSCEVGYSRSDNLQDYVLGYSQPSLRDSIWRAQFHAGTKARPYPGGGNAVLLPQDPLKSEPTMPPTTPPSVRSLAGEGMFA